jgi:hypothetical protein
MQRKPIPVQIFGSAAVHHEATQKDLYPLIDRIADQLPGWKAAFIHPTGRAALIKSVLTAIPVYHLIAR